jgi:hypothetical protein
MSSAYTQVFKQLPFTIAAEVRQEESGGYGRSTHYIA